MWDQEAGNDITKVQLFWITKKKKKTVLTLPLNKMFAIWGGLMQFFVFFLNYFVVRNLQRKKNIINSKTRRTTSGPVQEDNGI